MSSTATQIEPNYAESDAWILLALINSGRKGEPSSLRDLIANADAINHAIPTLEELNAGLNRLKAGGFMNIKENLFSPTRQALDLYERIAQGNKYVLAELKAIQRALIAADDLGRVEASIEIDSDTLSAAYKAYSKPLRKTGYVIAGLFFGSLIVLAIALYFLLPGTRWWILPASILFLCLFQFIKSKFEDREEKKRDMIISKHAKKA